MRPRQFLPLIGLLAWAAACAVASAHEVDQYNLPDDVELADVGDYWNQLLFNAVQDAVADLNDDIRIAQAIPVAAVRSRTIDHLHREATVAWRVRRQLPTGWGAIERAEFALRGRTKSDNPEQREVRRKYKASVFATTYNPLPFVPDPRHLNRALMLRCSLINVHGTYMGTDKIGHFVAMGYWYYLAHQTSLAAGASPDAAAQNAFRFGEWGPISEWGIVGGIPTGIYSNADMAANYCGMKFFVNLTRPVKLQGSEFPPMLVRDGDFWRLQPHVNPDGPFFGMFVSDHFDEVLNPCVYDWTMRAQIHREIRRHREQLLLHYAGNDPNKRSGAYFDRRTIACRKYYGEDYGHVGKERQLLALASICFQEDSQFENPWSPDSQTRVAEVDHPNRDQLRLSMPWAPTHSAGGESTRAVSLANLGGEACRNVRITVALPLDQQITAIEQPAGYDLDKNSLTWLIPSVEPNSEVTLRYEVVANAPNPMVTTLPTPQVTTVGYVPSLTVESSPLPAAETSQVKRPIVVFDPTRFTK